MFSKDRCKRIHSFPLMLDGSSDTSFILFEFKRDITVERASKALSTVGVYLDKEEMFSPVLDTVLHKMVCKNGRPIVTINKQKWMVTDLRQTSFFSRNLSISDSIGKTWIVDILSQRCVFLMKEKRN